MTDAELNRAVAEARGWKQCDCGDPDCPYWTDKNGSDWFNDVCTDPAAWGALLEELGAQGRLPHLMMGTVWNACVWREENGEWASDPAPGRALALAFLKAVQP